MSTFGGDKPAHLERAVNSILNQEFTMPVEVRLYLGIDGPVSADLAEVIDQLEPNIYRLFKFARNRGLAAVLNDLIAARDGEAFYFRMDADDVSLPHRFQKQINFMQAHPEIDILGTDLMERLEFEGYCRVIHFADGPVDARRQIAWRVPVAHPTVCFRASVFQKITRYPCVPLNEDVAMWIQCMSAGMNFSNIGEALYEFTIAEEFWRRRGIRKAWYELRSYLYGIWKINRFSWRYILPLGRFVSRMLPTNVQRILYSSRLRTRQLVPAPSNLASPLRYLR